MHCCGQERTTKFCPDCGTEASKDTLYLLLRHVKVNAKGAWERVEQQESRNTAASGAGMVSDRAKSRLRGRHRIHAKWQAWADELEKAIARIKELDDGQND